ncbi:MAG: FG-GAP repeat domain-containing protein [SAR324 cluster bacterium]
MPGAPSGTRDIVHTWRRLYYGVLDGKTSLLFAEAIERAKPAFGDMEGDGDLDLIVGTAQGRLLYFENEGDKKTPRWRLVNEALSALPPGNGPPGEDPQTVITVGANAAPALVDIDGDGDLDLFVGSADGKLAFYRNVGNAYLPIFRLESSDFLGKRFGQSIVPKFADVNGDGLPDLTLGNEAGEVWLLINQGTRQNPRFCAAPDTAQGECLIAPAKIVQLSGTDNAVPEWVDWNGDGLLDLMVGKSDGTLDYWQNIGTRAKPAWELKEPRFDILDAGSFAAPLFADVDGDGLPDLFLAGDREQMALYMGRLKDPKDRRAGLELWIGDDNVLQVRSLSAYDTRAHVASGDLFGKGRADLAVGTASGQILVYENAGGQDLPSFRSAGGPVLPVPQRGFSAPALADVDGDGLLDLIVGDRNGRLEWIKNVGTKTSPKWREGGLAYAGIEAGALSVPLFADVDGDGLPDLLVGDSRGQVLYYRNIGSAAAPQFQLTSANFGGMAVSGAASPALFQWNPKQPPDLVVGGQDGTLHTAVRAPGVPVLARGAFVPLAPWSNLRARAYSAPAFADLTGIGRPFLLLGTASGHVLLWRYEGSVSGKELARERPRGLNLLADRTPATPGSESGQLGAPSAQAAGGGTALTAPGEAPVPALPLDPIFQEEQSELNKLPVGRNSKPAFLDVDGDGRPDLIVGNADGKLLYFRNLGPAQNPNWQLVTSEFAGYRQGRNAAPTFVDVDGDGDLDLLVGTEDGQVFFFENVGGAAHPRFVYREDALRSVRAGKNAVPIGIALDPADVNSRPQLLVGSLRGGLQRFRKKAGPVLDYELAERRFLGIDLGVNTSPAEADVTVTRHVDLFIGTDKGPIVVLEPTGTSPLFSSGWKTNTTWLAGLTMPAGSHPALVDLDGDGDLDLVVGSDKGALVFFRNNAIVREGTANAGPAPSEAAAPGTR